MVGVCPFPDRGPALCHRAGAIFLYLHPPHSSLFHIQMHTQRFQQVHLLPLREALLRPSSAEGTHHRVCGSDSGSVLSRPRSSPGVVLNRGQFRPPGDLHNLWSPFWLSRLGCRDAPASGKQRPGSAHILRSRSARHTGAQPNATNAEAEKS